MLCMSLTKPLWLAVLLAGFLAYLWQPIANFRRLGRYPLSARAVLTMLLMLITMDCGKIFGYISGLNSSSPITADETGPRS